MPKRPATEIFATRVTGQPGLAEKLLDLVGKIPAPRETRAADPEARARVLARKTAIKTAASAGALALPPGPLGWLTIAPELYAVWTMQAQMVSDIAGAYGKRHLLTREQMLYCLFSHTAAGVFRNLVIRMGERYVVRRAPLSALYAIANNVALRIAQRSAGRVVTRWVPGIGALGVAGYVYYDTGKVADASIELFSNDLRIEGELEVEGVDVLAAATSGTGRKGGTTSPAARKPTAGTGAARNKAPKKTTARKAATKKASTKNAASKKAALKKTVAKKAGTKKVGTKKAGTKKVGMKNAATKRASPRQATAP